MNIAYSVVKSILRGGGIEKYTAEVGSRLVRRGHSVTVYSMANYGAEPRSYLGMQIVPCPTISSKAFEKLIAGAVAAGRIRARSDFDIVHQHSIAAGAFNWLACFARSGRSVLQMHGMEWRRTKWPAPARVLIRQLEGIAVRQVGHWTAVSRSDCRWLKSRYGVNATYIPTGSNIPSAPGCDLIRQEYGLEPGSYILFASRLVPEKGAHFLIEAFRGLKTDCRLVIAGDAPNEVRYARALREQANGDPRILFVGMVEGPRLNELFGNCSVFVQPSVVEGLSLGLLEAMSFGRCCLVSDIEENREPIAECGATFQSESPADLRDKLACLLREPALARSLGEAARARVAHQYSWDTVTDAIEALYQSMLASRQTVRVHALPRLSSSGHQPL